MRNFVKKILTCLFSKICLRNIKHGQRVKCNFYCKFTPQTEIGNNCHFNGTQISGSGRVIIGDNFHSGKHIRMLTTYHNFDRGRALPYDDTSYSKDITIGDNVWLGESVMILGGVTIGEGAVIQARSVVCKDVPPLAIAGGHPAVPFKYRDKVHYDTLKAEGKYM